MRVPISGIYKIKGAGDVLTGRVEQGTVKPGEEVIFLPTHTAALACEGKVFSVEMHHKSVTQATAGDNVGLNIKGLKKENMPRTGDIMILKSDKNSRKNQELYCPSADYGTSWRTQGWIFSHCFCANCPIFCENG